MSYPYVLEFKMCGDKGESEGGELWTNNGNGNDNDEEIGESDGDGGVDYLESNDNDVDKDNHLDESEYESGDIVSGTWSFLIIEVKHKR